MTLFYEGTAVTGDPLDDIEALTLAAADQLDPTNATESRFADYRFRVVDYVADMLGRPLWGDPDEPGQVAVALAYEKALLQLHERADYENGVIGRDQLEHWQPGQVIQNWIAIDAGHNVGKTRLLGALTSHFFDCFIPCVGYAYAPEKDQVNDLLFKEIRLDREGRPELYGEVMLEPRIKHRANHFIKGHAANAAETKTQHERKHGQHERYMIFVIDEAEGVPKYIFDSVDSMASGGICVVLISRNPRSRKSYAHKVQRRANVATFRISCFDFPNVKEGRDVIPGAVRRDYVETMLEKCEEVPKHNPDEWTFSVPWHNDGKIYKPDIEFLWRVLGVPAAYAMDNTFCPVGRYETARKREPITDAPDFAAIGIDAARYGSDYAKIYVAHNGRVWLHESLGRADYYAHYMSVVRLCRELSAAGVEHVSVRVDAGGGYGGGVVDFLNHSHDPRSWFLTFGVHEIHFNAKPVDRERFADRITELYYYAGEALQVLALDNPPPELETDICERPYKYVRRNVEVMKNGRVVKVPRDVKQLLSKDHFKNKEGRSPDDGDGLALAVAPEWIAADPVILTRTRKA